jgi:hydroxymethylbilane synthase
VLDDFLPALSQGAIGIEIRDTDTHAREIVAQLNDRDTELALDCERAFQHALGGSCRSPMAGLAIVSDGRLHFRGEVLAPDGSEYVQSEIEIALTENAREEAMKAGREAGLDIRPRAEQWLHL